MEYSNPGLPSWQSSPCPTYVVTDCSNSEKGCNQNIAGSKLKVLREVRKCGRRPRGLMYPEDGGRHCIGCVGIIYQSARRHIPQDLNLYRTSVKISDLAYCNLSRVKWDRNVHIDRPVNLKRPSIAGRGPAALFFRNSTEGFWAQPAFLFSAQQSHFLRDRAAGAWSSPLTPPSTVFYNEWSYISTPRIAFILCQKTSILNAYIITYTHTYIHTYINKYIHKTYVNTYVVGSKSFRPDQLFKVTEIKQLCYFST